MADRFDVVISGGGLAGCTTAIGLARAGLRVALVERLQWPRPKLCGEYLSPETWPIFEELGVAETLEASGYQPIVKSRLTTPSGRFLDAPARDRHGRSGLALSREKLDQILAERAARLGVVLMPLSDVRGPWFNQSRVGGLRVRRTKRAVEAVRADWTIAAEGRHSKLVRQTGRVSQVSRLRSPLFGFKTHLKLDETIGDEPDQTVSLHLVPGGYVGSCRIEGGWVNLCGAVPESWIRECRGDLDLMANRFFSLNPRLEQLWSSRRSELSQPWKTVGRVLIQRARPDYDGILYVGDALGTIDPLAGLGMTLALAGGNRLTTHFLNEAARSPSGTLAQSWEAVWIRQFRAAILFGRVGHHLLTHPLLMDQLSRLGQVGHSFLRLGYDLGRTRFVPTPTTC